MQFYCSQRLTINQRTMGPPPKRSLRIYRIPYPSKSIWNSFGKRVNHKRFSFNRVTDVFPVRNLPERRVGQPFDVVSRFQVFRWWTTVDLQRYGDDDIYIACCGERFTTIESSIITIDNVLTP